MDAVNDKEFKAALKLTDVAKEGQTIAVLEYKEWHGDKYLIAQDQNNSSKKVIYRIDLELIENHELKVGGMFTITYKPAIKPLRVCSLKAGEKF